MREGEIKTVCFDIENGVLCETFAIPFYMLSRWYSQQNDGMTGYNLHMWGWSIELSAGIIWTERALENGFLKWASFLQARLKWWKTLQCIWHSVDFICISQVYRFREIIVGIAEGKLKTCLTSTSGDQASIVLQLWECFQPRRLGLSKLLLHGVLNLRQQR